MIKLNILMLIIPVEIPATTETEQPHKFIQQSWLAINVYVN